MKMPRAVGLIGLWALVGLPGTADVEPAPPGWDEIGAVKFEGGLKAFWDVGGADKAANQSEAAARGFELVDLLSTYADYPGRQKERIVPDGANPWKKPPFFERIIRRNIAQKRGLQLFVHDIEFQFEEDLGKLWADPELRKLSGARTPEGFKDAYYREWGSWYALPCQWAKEKFPESPVGIYGPQPFRRDYWGVAGKDAQQIDGTHETDADLWEHIHPSVDFVIASIYCFYDNPGSVYYMASNVEENRRRIVGHGEKPLYAYTWLRYHNSNKKLGSRELDGYLVEAMAVLPYFCGARGVVLWGWEPKGKGPYYEQLPLFVRSLRRVADLSAKISVAQPDNEVPVHVLWKTKQPLVRKLRVAGNEWLVLATNPWQEDDAESVLTVECGAQSLDLTVRGRHTEIFHVLDGKATRIEMGESGHQGGCPESLDRR
jgi:hypothetical protein